MSNEAIGMNEVERSAALHSYGVLDTPREEDFDDLAKIAAEVCGTPIAVVNLVDTHRQFFKAEVGLGVRETLLETSFCGHAILAEDMMIVPDAAMDPRFDCNPLVVGEPGLRFYAGALLRTPAGFPIGTMCVLDFEPRELNENQIRTLKLLARQAVTQLELRRAEAEQRLLNQELSHRLKNTLAMVQAIATQTLRSADDREMVDAFVQRIHTLSAAHDVLLQKSWAAAAMRDVVRAVLSPFGQTAQFDISGPDIQLGPRTTLSLSLLLHELATNAVKYGALSTPDGRVELRWHLEEENECPNLVLGWRESGGPPVEEPKRKGFGSRLIRMGLIGTGGVDLNYDQPGFSAELRASLSQMQQS